ncbi:ABC transporter ATP-binding protein [Actinacidiphila alni]|uniref:ABC transporter ATP-binding protein n=1 Tax=Actinacidiphila alni TaxID=380248 RepID=UPI0033E3BBF4
MTRAPGTPDVSAAPVTPLIDIHEVRKSYDDGPPALDALNLTVRAGEALAVLGPSGSGKSTLLNMVAGLDRPTGGSVTVDGVRVDTLSETASARYRRQRIGMVFQFFNLLDDLTVLDNVLLPSQLVGAGRAQARARAAELLDYLGIARHARAYPGRLSGGERQRVAVARALMNRPALLLADEPTGALDTASGAEVRALLTALNADGQTILLVTHDLALAEACATRTIELVDGRIVRDVSGGSLGDSRPGGSLGDSDPGGNLGDSGPGGNLGAAKNSGGPADGSAVVTR